MELFYIWLTLVFNYNYSEIEKFLTFFDSPEEIFNLSSTQWHDFNLSENLIKKLTSKELKNKAESILTQCQKENIQIILKNSKNYPKNLLNINSKPILLYIKGNLSVKDEFSFAIVGSRKCSDYGRIATTKIATELSNLDIPIVSGMARGIDSFAHSAAVNNQKRTIAVLGCGVNVIYPAENKNLYNKIIENGAIISEFIPNSEPLKPYFPLRNRIISGISLGTLVVEASQKSGSMITASYAAEQGKDIFAVPGNIFSSQSEGTNNLIKDGAKIVTKTEDILEELYINLTNISKQQMEIPVLTGNEKLLFDLINFEPISLENLLSKSSLPLYELNSTLTVLELSGYINKLSGNNFIRNEKYIL